MDTIATGEMKSRATSEGKLYEKGYSVARTNVIVYRRLLREFYPLWLECQKANVESGKWKEDPKAANLVVPPDDEDLGPFKEGDSPVDLFASVDLAALSTAKKGPWWRTYSTVRIFTMQVRHSSVQSDSSLNIFPVENAMHEGDVSFGARQG